MNLYVSNLSFQVTDEELKAMFSKFGEVSSVKVISDRETGRSRGFAFVEMPDEAAANAMKELNGVNKDGRAISVSQAKPKPSGGSSFRDRDRNNRW